jgi:NAD(P)H-dependent FMN reductase
MSSAPKLLFLAGSARVKSLNKLLARCAFEIAKKTGVDAHFIDLIDYPMPIYDGDLEAKDGVPENVPLLKKLFVESDGIFIASPEYSSSFSPLLKNVIDWMSRSTVPNEEPNLAYRNKIIAMGSASPGGFGGYRGLMQLQEMFSNIGGIVLPQKILVPKAHEKFVDNSLSDEKIHAELVQLVDRLVLVCRKLKS